MDWSFPGFAGGKAAGDCALGKTCGLSIVAAVFSLSAIGRGDELPIAVLTQFLGTRRGGAFLSSREVHGTISDRFFERRALRLTLLSIIGLCVQVMVHQDGSHMSNSHSATVKPKSPHSTTNASQEVSASTLPKPKKDRKPDLTSQSVRGRRNDSSLGGEGTGHVTALWIVCKKKIAADKNMIGVEKMLGNLPDLTGMTVDKLKNTLTTTVLQKSPGDIAEYSHVLGQLARARIAVLENRTDAAVDADAVVPKFIYSLINTVVLLHPSGTALGGVAKQRQIDTELAYLASILKHRLGLAGLVESAEQEQLTKSEKKDQKQSGGVRRGSAPTIFVRPDDVGRKPAKGSGHSPDGKTQEKKGREKKSDRHVEERDESGELGEKHSRTEKPKKEKVKRVKSEDLEMGPPAPEYVPVGPLASKPPQPGLRMLPLTPTPLSSVSQTPPPPYSPRVDAYQASSNSAATTTTSNVSSMSATSTAVPPTTTGPGSPPEMPRPGALGAARRSVRLQNLGQLMEKNLAKFREDMEERGSSLMLRVVKVLPTDYELATSDPDAVNAYVRNAIQKAGLSQDEIKELAALNPAIHKNGVRANQLSLMHLLIVEVAKGMLKPAIEFVPFTPSPLQARVDAAVNSLLANLDELELDKLLNTNWVQDGEDTLLVSSRSPSPDARSAQTASNLTGSNPHVLPQPPSGAAPSRVNVANYRTKVATTSVPPSPRSYSRESSGDGNTNLLATSPRKPGSSKPMENERASAPVSRESSGSDLDESSGATSNVQNASSPVQRGRSASQRNMVIPQSPPRTLINKREHTGGAQQSAPASPEKGSPGKPQEAGQAEKKQ